MLVVVKDKIKLKVNILFQDYKYVVNECLDVITVELDCIHNKTIFRIFMKMYLI